MSNSQETGDTHSSAGNNQASEPNSAQSHLTTFVSFQIIDDTSPSTVEEGSAIEIPVVLPFSIAEGGQSSHYVVPIMVSPRLLNTALVVNVVFNTREDGAEIFRDLRKQLERRGRLKEYLRKAKPYTYKRSMPPAECSICLADFEVRDKIRRLGCRHEFHRQCVDQWLLKGDSLCPICRREPFERAKPGNPECKS